MLDAEDILNGIVRGALSSRGKSWSRTRHAARSSGLINARTLLAAAGVAWGLFETWQGQQQQAGASGTPAARRHLPKQPLRPRLPKRRACPRRSRGCFAS